MKLSAGGFHIDCSEQGDGRPPLVLVHSSGLSARQWTPLRRAFEATQRVLVPDLIGYGASDGWTRDRPFTLDLDTAAVVAVLDYAAEPAVLVGHSYGGMLALKAALARPERVAALVVHEPVAWGVLASSGEDELVRQFEVINEDGLFFDPVRGGSDAWYERFIDFWSGPGAWRSLPAPRKEGFLRVGAKVFDEVRALTTDPTPHQAYQAIAAPTFVTCGDGTVEIERRVCSIIAAAIDGAALRAIPGGHMAPLTHADAFVECVRDAVARVA